MERNEQLHEEAEVALDEINKKTGRNMPQAIGTAVVLIAIILAAMLLSIDLFVALIVVFMILALWELRVDFATVGLHIPFAMLCVCSAATLFATYYAPLHVVAMALCAMASIMLVALTATAKLSFGNRLSLAVADKLSHTEAGARLESSFNHEGGEQHHSRLSHVSVSVLMRYPTRTTLCISSQVGCGMDARSVPPASWGSPATCPPGRSSSRCVWPPA